MKITGAKVASYGKAQQAQMAKNLSAVAKSNYRGLGNVIGKTSPKAVKKGTKPPKSHIKKMMKGGLQSLYSR